MSGDRFTPLGSLSVEQRRLFAEIGAAWDEDINKHRDLVFRTYAPLAAGAPKAGARLVPNLAYGPHARQVLDVFAPEGARNADVVLFVHGGAFIRGSKSVNGEIYDNVSRWFARQGLVAVNVEYRLAADAPYPGGAADVARSVRWCVENIDRFGGNPGRLFLIGHSAGGTHVATYVFDPGLEEKPGRELRGIVLVSARLRADVHADNPNAPGVRAYFGEDASRYEERSPVTHAGRSSIPLLIAVAEHENPYLDVYGAEFHYRAAAERKRAPRFIQLPKHNHTSIVAHFNTGEELLGREILDFMATCR